MKMDAPHRATGVAHQLRVLFGSLITATRLQDKTHREMLQKFLPVILEIQQDGSYKNLWLSGVGQGVLGRMKDSASPS